MIDIKEINNDDDGDIKLLERNTFGICIYKKFRKNGQISKNK